MIGHSKELMMSRAQGLPKLVAAALISLAVLASYGCKEEQAVQSTSEEKAQAAEGESVVVESQLGPVSTRVRLSPKAPVLGDVMELHLEVVAERGVEVDMPSFQEAFSRFAIEDYSESQSTRDGKQVWLQKYFLQAGSSGRMRVPPLRVAFVDSRQSSDEGTEERELLTEEIPFQVSPVLLGEDAKEASLRPIRRPLEEKLGASLAEEYWWAIAGGVGLLLLGAAAFWIKRNRKVIQISPYERASVALAQLEAQGLPDDEERDHWYVELSHIVRQYLEGRFALRAPELTTEEFLRVAQKSERLSDEHKNLLRSFLADCDKVKFAGYEPGEEESRSVLEAARRFLLETRVIDEEQSEKEAA